MIDEPTLEAHARQLLGLPDDWQIYRWEVKGMGVLVEGSVVPTATYKRGRFKGGINWSKRDKATEASLTIPNDRHREWLIAWEARTGKCHECRGTTQEWAGWSATSGNSYRPCRRCDATGEAQPGTPIR